MSKDYYDILGIGSDASPDQIRSAYRKKAKEHHPDCTGGSCEPFLDLQEAYEVLGDPTRRRAYDDERFATRWREIEPLHPRRAPVEPLDDSPIASAGLDPLFVRVWNAVGGLGWLEAEDIEDIHLEVTLTHDQARHGGSVRMWVPTEVRCPTCRGSGQQGFFPCWRCHGQGMVRGERPVTLPFGAGIHNGAVLRTSLGRYGIPRVYLTVRFRVR